MMRFIKENYFLIVFAICIGFVGVVSGYKLFIRPPEFVYVKVKVGQGQWYSSSRPNEWLWSAIKGGKVEKNAFGQPLVEIKDVTFYPYASSLQFDIYVTARLRVDRIGKAKKYLFKRETIGVGSPIEFEFNEVQYAGSIISLSERPISDSYIKKTVTFLKKNALPWEYEKIQVGDAMTNGKTKVLEVLEKSMVNEDISLTLALWGHIEEGQFVFAEEKLVIPGKTISLATKKTAFSDFTITRVE